MSKMPQTKRGKRTYVDQSERLSHKFVTVRRGQRAVAVRMGMYGLDDRRARRGLDGRCCAIIVCSCAERMAQRRVGKKGEG